MLSIAEAEKILQESSDRQLREDAQRALVEHASFSESAWYAFMREHSGQHGLLSNGSGKPDLANLVSDVQANKHLLMDWAKANCGEGITPATLEKAFAHYKDTGQLAPLPKAIDPAHKTGERKSANGNERNLFRDQPSRAADEYRTQQAAPPFTKADLLKLAGQVRGIPGDLPRFKAIVAKWGSPAINAILQAD